ncbi:MAG: hypothetical protein Q9218_002925 [Villophora microphyllina]
MCAIVAEEHEKEDAEDQLDDASNVKNLGARHIERLVVLNGRIAWKCAFAEARVRRCAREGEGDVCLSKQNAMKREEDEERCRVKRGRQRAESLARRDNRRKERKNASRIANDYMKSALGPVTAHSHHLRSVHRIFRLLKDARPQPSVYPMNASIHNRHKLKPLLRSIKAVNCGMQKQFSPPPGFKVTPKADPAYKKAGEGMAAKVLRASIYFETQPENLRLPLHADSIPELMA